MSDANNQGFVADGYERARVAVYPKIRAQVRNEFDERLTNASFAERVRLQREMNQEIKRRINTVAPPDALY